MKWINRLLLLLISGLLVFVVIPGVANTNQVLRAMLDEMPLGWWHFLRRNVREVAWNWNLWLMALVCSASLLLVGHWLIRTLVVTETRFDPSLSRLSPWKLQHTLVLYAVLWVLFAIACGSIGIYRQASWLAKIEGPWYEERLNYYGAMRHADLELQTFVMDHDGDFAKVRRDVNSSPVWGTHERTLNERFEVILYANSSNTVDAYLIIPRNPQLVARGRFLKSTPQTNDMAVPLSKLRETIAELDNSYSPLARQP